VFATPRIIESRVFARVPDAKLLEGPSFDRAGNLYVVDIPNGRIFRISPDGRPKRSPSTTASPTGSRSTGTAASSSPTTSRVSSGSTRQRGAKGLNDLLFSRNGDLYFTDQGESDLRDLSGRLYCLRADGRLDCLLDNVSSPNGLVLTPDESILYLAA
jgi:gluconolactonase